MQLSTESATPVAPSAVPALEEAGAAGRDARYDDYKVIRRNGAVVGFEPAKVAIAMTKAFIAVNGGQGAASAACRWILTED